MLMGDKEVFTNMNFILISTLPFEFRPNIIELKQQGEAENNDTSNNGNDEHPPDAFMNQLPVQLARQSKKLQSKQQMSVNQIATCKNHDGKPKVMTRYHCFHYKQQKY